MTNTLAPAAATALPAVTTRRRALASLAGLGAALAAPKAVRAASAGGVEIEELAARYTAAHDRMRRALDAENGIHPAWAALLAVSG